MAPQTRNGRKKVVKVVPGISISDLKKNDVFEWVLKNEMNQYRQIGNDIVKDFILKVDGLSSVTKDRNRILEIKKAIQECIDIVPEPRDISVIKTRKIKKEIVVKEEIQPEEVETKEENKEETMTISESSYISEALAVRSETLTSSDDDCDKTAISETTQQLEEMSITEEMELSELNIPLHTSTPLRENSVISVIKQEEIQVFGVLKKSESTKNDDSEVRILKSSIKATEISQRKTYVSSRREVKPTPGIRNQSKSIINLETPTHSGYRRNLFASKSESVASILPKPETYILRNPKPENIEKKNHLSFLRSKIQNTKLEKGRELMKKKPVVVEKKPVPIEKKSSSYKSISRNTPILKRTEATTPGHRPLKKSRVPVPEREKNVPLLKTPVPVLSIPNNSPGICTLKNTDKFYQSKNQTLVDYGLDYLSSEGDTDDEYNPKFKIPSWAADFDVVEANVQKQIVNPPFDIDEFFGEIEKPNLLEIFGPKTRGKKRGSSACW